jgi:hypothetical protein
LVVDQDTGHGLDIIGIGVHINVHDLEDVLQEGVLMNTE